MVRRKERLFAEIMLAADVVTLFATLAAAHWLRLSFLSSMLGPTPSLRAYAWTAPLVVLIFVIGLARGGFYRSEAYQQKSRIFGSTIRSSSVGALLLGLVFAAKRPALGVLALDLIVLVCMVAALAVEKLVVKALLDWIAQRRREQGAWQVLIIGERDDAHAYQRLLERHQHWAIAVAGVLSPVQEMPVAVAARGGGVARIVKGQPDWRHVLRDYVVDEVVAIVRWPQVFAFGELQEASAERGLIFRTLVQMPKTQVGRYQFDEVGEGMFLVSLEAVPQDFLPLLLKRLMDMVGSLAGLAICGLVYAWYAPRIRRESPGPVFFRQKRVGQNGRPFVCYKFRTMYVDADKKQVEMLATSRLGRAFIKFEDDPRTTPTGKWMRRYHLDELPQFWNVLKGEMSLVGPRPSQPVEVSQYEYAHHRRHSIKPGISCLFQVSGHASVNGFDDVVKLDCEYIDNWSLWLDLKIIFQTLVKVFRGDGL